MQCRTRCLILAEIETDAYVIMYCNGSRRGHVHASFQFTNMSCPVDHSALAQPKDAATDKCPVDHASSSTWATLAAGTKNDSAPLSNSRETSSIPRVEGENWVYPSESQFYSAMARKNHNPQAPDMKVIVPIHNAVNERTWNEVLKWEEGRGAEKCGGVKLVSFKGRPKDLSPRARWKSLLGYVSH